MSSVKRLLALAFAMSLLAAACGSDSETDAGSDDGTTTTEATDDGGETTTTEATDDGAEAGDCSSEDVLCVGLVTDVGKIDDKSFNQSAWEGVQASDADVKEFIETQDSKDYATNIGTFLEQDYDVVVTVGFALGEATLIAAGENPDTLFIGVDQFQGEPVDNVAGLIFPEDQAGFIAGALAGLLTETNIVAAVLGTDLVPPVVAFREGYAAGIEYTNPDAELLSTYHPGGLDVAFVDPAWGADTARQALDSGADVVFGAGGLDRQRRPRRGRQGRRRCLLHRRRLRPVGDRARGPSVPRDQRHEADQPRCRRPDRPGEGRLDDQRQLCRCCRYRPVPRFRQRDQRRRQGPDRRDHRRCARRLDPDRLHTLIIS